METASHMMTTSCISTESKLVESITPFTEQMQPQKQEISNVAPASDPGYTDKGNLPRDHATALSNNQTLLDSKFPSQRRRLLSAHESTAKRPNSPRQKVSEITDPPSDTRTASTSGRSKAVSISSVSESESAGPVLRGKKLTFPSEFSTTFGPILERPESLCLLIDDETASPNLPSALDRLCIGDFYDEDTLQCFHCQKKYDDTDGFLCLKVDDLIRSKVDSYFHQMKERNFRVLAVLGQGTFGTVYKCVESWVHLRAAAPPMLSSSAPSPPSFMPRALNGDTVSKMPTNVSLLAYGTKITLPQSQFAIKIIRNIPKYRRAARKELEILELLQTSRSRSNNGCISLLGAFEFRHHICMIFPLLQGDLYSVLETNHFRGIVLEQIKPIARQLFRSLVFLQEKGIIHTDLKPENIMLVDSSLARDTPSDSRGRVTLSRTDIQLIDFGSAIYQPKHPYHPELVSTRHYRAPEVILGLDWSFPIDVWSIGCILMELYLGRQIFSTHSNLEHIAMMAKFLGIDSFPEAMSQAHAKAFQDKQRRNLSSSRYGKAASTRRGKRREAPLEELLLDEMTHIPLFKKLDSPNYLKLKPLDELSLDTGDALLFKDLIRQCLQLDPTARVTPSAALSHAFLRT